MSPLESALGLLESINQDFNIPQQDYKNVCTSLKELVCIFVLPFLLLLVLVIFFFFFNLSSSKNVWNFCLVNHISVVTLSLALNLFEICPIC